MHYSAIAELHTGNEETRRRLAVYCLKDALLPQARAALRPAALRPAALRPAALCAPLTCAPLPSALLLSALQLP